MTATYRTRDRLLAGMGYATYAAYLRSPAWAVIRRTAWAVHGYRCRLCEGSAAEIHHLSYSRAVLTGRDLSALAPLCRACHTTVEFTPAGRKRTLSGAGVQYRKMLAGFIKSVRAKYRPATKATPPRPSSQKPGRGTAGTRKRKKRRKANPGKRGR